MRRFIGLSLNRKLTLLITLTSSVALLVCSASFLLNDVVTLHAAKVEQLTALADVLASNSSAVLLFRQSESAERLLASLSKRPTIEYACLFEEDGTILASYQEQTESHFTPPPPQSAGHTFSADGHLEIVHAVTMDGEVLGHIFLHATMDDVKAQYYRHAGITAVAITLSMVVTLMLSYWLQRIISSPILHLAKAAEAISRDRDYSIRVRADSEDEIGRLYEQFNEMLDRIQQGESELRHARDKLEIRVGERTQELAEANVSLQEQMERYRAISESAQDAIITCDVAGNIRLWNRAAESIFGYKAETIVGRNVQDTIFPRRHADPNQEAIRRFVESGAGKSFGKVMELGAAREDGSQIPVELSLSTYEENEGVAVLAVIRDISERKQAEAELKEMHDKLIVAARDAGMAEVATDVLHNVGNVLNGVNVSVELMRETLQQSEVADLNRVFAMIEEHAADLGAFFSSDARGQHVPDYLSAAGKTLQNERDELVTTVTSLRDNVEHIKTIVSMQQSYTRFAGMTQSVSLARLLDDALALQAASLERHRIRVVRQYEAVADVTVDNHKLLQVIVNLIKNAKEAIVELEQHDGMLCVKVLERDENQIRIEVSDNGPGIDPQNLDRIFSYGFTTKLHGHGFGLHSCANLVKEMDGTISVHSDGAGSGAVFAVDLPAITADAVV